MTRSSSDSTSQLDELTAALRQLDLARARIARAIALFSDTSPSPPPRRPSPAPTHRSVSPERQPPLLPNSPFRLTDRVRIRYPNRGQQSTGVIVGATRGGYLCIRTPNGDVIRRLPHNILLDTS